MNIGAKIKQLRQELGLTQEELADRAELSKSFISQLERDLTSPSINTCLLYTSVPHRRGVDFPVRDVSLPVALYRADPTDGEDEVGTRAHQPHPVGAVQQIA